MYKHEPYVTLIHSLITPIIFSLLIILFDVCQLSHQPFSFKVLQILHTIHHADRHPFVLIPMHAISWPSENPRKSSVLFLKRLHPDSYSIALGPTQFCLSLPSNELSPILIYTFLRPSTTEVRFLLWLRILKHPAFQITCTLLQDSLQWPEKIAWLKNNVLQHYFVARSATFLFTYTFWRDYSFQFCFNSLHRFYKRPVLRSKYQNFGLPLYDDFIRDVGTIQDTQFLNI